MFYESILILIQYFYNIWRKQLKYDLKPGLTSLDCATASKLRWFFFFPFFFLAVQNSSIGHPVQDNHQKPQMTTRTRHITAMNQQIQTRNHRLGKLSFKKTVKKGDIVPFWRSPPPKRVKRGHCCLITDKSA